MSTPVTHLPTPSSLCDEVRQRTRGTSLDTAADDFEEQINAAVMEAFEAKCRFFERATADVARAARLIIESLRAGGKLMLCGNGGSAADAQHIATELAFRMGRDRAALAALALTTDTSLLTAVSNDKAFQYVFSRQIAALGRAGDVLIAISTSGNSPNVIEAVKQAREMDIRTIGLLGHEGGCLGEMVDLPLVVPSRNTPRIQEVHIEVCHIICGLVEDALCPV